MSYVIIIGIVCVIGCICSIIVSIICVCDTPTYLGRQAGCLLPGRCHMSYVIIIGVVSVYKQYNGVY
jgi:hypothetical protein